MPGQNEDRRSDERKQAESIFLESGGDVKLVDIAEKLNLPANKIRKWKSLDKWDEKLRLSGKKKQVERSTKNKWSVPPKTSGAFHQKQVERSTKKRCAKGK